MNYQDVINKLEALADDHVFIKQFGYGNISDIAVPEDKQAPDYPYMFVNPVDVNVERRTFTFTFNLIMMTQVEDTEDTEIQGQSRCMSYIEDIMSYFTNSTNEPLYDVSLPYAVTPFKERLQDDVVGATATITMQLAEPLDYCDAPYASGVVGAKSISLPFVTVTDGDGTDVQVTVGSTYACLDASPKSGIYYQRIIPWDQNDPGIDGSVAYHKALGTYDYAPPKNPLYVAALQNGYNGDDINALLVSNNAFGNKYRFTNDVGEQFVEGFATSGANSSLNKRYCIDHYTGLGWYIQDAYDYNTITYPESMAYSLTFSYGGYSDWRLADISEYLNSVNYNDWGNSYTAVYAPFVDNNIRNYGGKIATGTYTKDNQYCNIQTNGGTVSLTSNATATTQHQLLIRNHYI